MQPEDRAQKLELEEWERTQQRALLPKPLKPSAHHCCDPYCGEEIPEARRVAYPGTQFCTECQALRERQ